MKRLRVGVLYGGRSGEHEISLASAAAIFANLDRQRYEPIAIRIEKDGRWVLADRPPSAASAAEVIDLMRTDSSRLRGGREVYLPPRPGEDTLVVVDRSRAKRDGDDDGTAAVTGVALDVVFPVLHGPFGEDGTIQGLLELANVAYVGCGVLASAAGMDKGVMKSLFRANGIRTPDWLVVRQAAWARDPESIRTAVRDALGDVVFVKPANLGSSIGITRVSTPDGLGPALETAFTYERKAIVEAAVPDAREIECGVIGDETPEASLPGEIVPAGEFYDYEAKYLNQSSQLVVPAPLDETTTAEIRQQAVRAFQVIDASGLARVDFLLNRSTGALYVNEINTLPGFTTISMFAKMWVATGVEYPVLLDRLIALARERHAARQPIRTTTV